MEWLGFLALIILLCYSSYPGKVKKLESAVKKIERMQKGDNSMSKLISELVNKECIITLDEALVWVGDTHVTCHVLDVDDEWLKIRYTDKKKKQVTKIVRIESIDNVEIVETPID